MVLYNRHGILKDIDNYIDIFICHEDIHSSENWEIVQGLKLNLVINFRMLCRHIKL